MAILFPIPGARSYVPILGSDPTPGAILGFCRLARDRLPGLLNQSILATPCEPDLPKVRVRFAKLRPRVGASLFPTHAILMVFTRQRRGLVAGDLFAGSDVRRAAFAVQGQFALAPIPTNYRDHGLRRGQ